MPCCEYQIFMTLSSLPPVLVILLFIQTTLLIFPICPLLHPDMPCFTSQYAVFRTAKVAYRITILLFMRVVLSALFVVNAVLVSVFFIGNKKSRLNLKTDLACYSIIMSVLQHKFNRTMVGAVYLGVDACRFYFFCQAV